MKTYFIEHDGKVFAVAAASDNAVEIAEQVTRDIKAAVVISESIYAVTVALENAMYRRAAVTVDPSGNMDLVHRDTCEMWYSVYFQDSETFAPVRCFLKFHRIRYDASGCGSGVNVSICVNNDDVNVINRFIDNPVYPVGMEV